MGLKRWFWGLNMKRHHLWTVPKTAAELSQYFISICLVVTPAISLVYKLFIRSCLMGVILSSVLSQLFLLSSLILCNIAWDGWRNKFNILPIISCFSLADDGAHPHENILEYKQAPASRYRDTQHCMREVTN